MQIIIPLFVGPLVGMVLRLVFPARDPGGIFMTITLGLAGAAVATFAARGLGVFRADQAGYAVLVSFIGAVFLLGAYRMASPRRIEPKI